MILSDAACRGNGCRPKGFEYIVCWYLVYMKAWGYKTFMTPKFKHYKNINVASCMQK